MTHLLVIAIMVMASVRDLAPGPLAGSVWLSAHPWAGLAMAMGPYAALIMMQLSVGRACYRRLDRTGSTRWVYKHETVAGIVRMATLPAHASAVLVFGLLDSVRAVVGDLVAVDELIVLAPPFAVLAITWATSEPIERRLREALLIRRLDEGLEVPPMPRPWVWWAGIVKMQLLFAALPVALIMSWAEGVAAVRDALWRASQPAGAVHGPDWARSAPDWLRDPDVLGYGSAGLQLVGVLCVLALLPLALRFLWDTEPLGDGPMRERLLGMCRQHRVRVRQLLVWRTHGGMINGAVIGLLPRIRYIILTDSLLSTLPASQVEAVTAHEIAHVRRRHIPWLGGAMLGTALSIASGGSLLLRQIGVGNVTTGWTPIAVMAVAFGGALLVFGWVSRTFERQADAFAAAHVTSEDQPAATDLTEAGARAMSGALRAVAVVNGVSMERFTWRHGSIAGRRRALADSVGRPLEGLPQDRAARRAKLAVGAMIVLAVGLSVLEALAASGNPG